MSVPVFFVHAVEVCGNQNCMVPNILQNVFFCILQNKEIHAGLEQHQGE